MGNTRKNSLATWLQSELPGSHETIKLSLISGDASFRKYYRIRVGGLSYIAVDAPPEHEDSYRFIRIANLFRDASVITPNVFFQNMEQGFMLLEDFGDQTFLNKLSILKKNSSYEEINHLYEVAIDSLIDIQFKVNGDQLDHYDRELLYNEMTLFNTWFCESFLKLKPDEKSNKLISQAFTFLEKESIAQKQVPVHRDYHSRNLMVLGSQNTVLSKKPGVIDFQDAVVGPYTYDLVSLLRDAYIKWDTETIYRWVDYYLEKCKQANLLNKVSRDEFVRQFDLMGLQRQLKVMGIFARLAIRDKKAGYLADIPLVMNYFLEIGQKYDELGPFIRWFKDNVVCGTEAKIKPTVE